MTEKKKYRLNITPFLLLALVIVAAVAVIFGISSAKHKGEAKRLAGANSELTVSLNDTSDVISDLNERVASGESRIAEYEKEVSDLEEQLTQALARKAQAGEVGSVDDNVSLSPQAQAALDRANTYDGPKTCYLTFDDGPTTSTTPRILDILAQEGVKATFFVIHDNPELLKRIHNEGHAIGLHSASHDYSRIYSSEQAFFKDIEKIGDVVYNAVGFRPRIIRFPGGSSNTVSRGYCKGIMSRLSKSVVEKGYLYYDWNASNGDANGSNISEATLIQNIRNDGASSQRVIVLMHDAGDKGTTADALPEIISYYRDAGYTFDIITEQTPMMTHGINN